MRFEQRNSTPHNFYRLLPALGKQRVHTEQHFPNKTDGKADILPENWSSKGEDKTFVMVVVVVVVFLLWSVET